MLIDCDTCTARPLACGDCVVTHLLSTRPARPSGERPSATELTAPEVAAVAVLSAQGLVPPLRLVTATPRAAPRDHDDRAAASGQ
ncbi:hypothetical protein [Aquipuribacter sp. SD81]|uniref:hypothetical protein n=1 Tax=Aquipuribacter sp. SD81 TaxID=3127703 RepID=UPI00301AABAF